MGYTKYLKMESAQYAFMEMQREERMADAIHDYGDSVLFLNISSFGNETAECLQ